MKYLATILFVLPVLAYAKPIIIKLCKEKDYDCQYVHLQDVKNIERINSGSYLRITFFNNSMLDINISNKYYEIKK